MTYAAHSQPWPGDSAGGGARDGSDVPRAARCSRPRAWCGALASQRRRRGDPLVTTAVSSGTATRREPEQPGLERTARVLQELGEAEGAEEHTRLLHEVVVANMPMADAIAQRYRSRGV